MKIVGIIPAKENSNRFPGKNYYNYKGEPLFYHNVKLLQNSPYIDTVYVSTNSLHIIKLCQLKNIGIIYRLKNISRDDQPIFEVLKYSYQSLNEEYDAVACILANTIGHTQENIDEALYAFIRYNNTINNGIYEIRSYDRKGIENGILLLHHNVFNKHEISTYMGMIITDGKEIHHPEDLKDES